jgi:hypothetical protein
LEPSGFPADGAERHASEASPADPIQFAQLVIREQILIRVPMRLA